MALANLLAIIFCSIVYALWVYNTVISFKGFGSVKSPDPATMLRRFAVLVPACNEEAVIQGLLESLHQQNYPQTRFDVFVSADNCTDRTAEVSAQLGAKVFKRRNTTGGGKAENIRFALGQIELDTYDALAIFDADNLVHRDFLSSMNNFLEANPEAEAVQGYLDVKNPNDSWISLSYAMMYMFINRFWQLARARLGLSAQLGGTGAVIRTTVLRRYGWSTQSLTEDLELSVKLIRQGKRVFWNHEAVIYDEKPVSYRVALTQRQRWSQGHYWNLFKHFRPLLLALVKGNTGPSRLQCIDALFFLMLPGQMLIAYLSMLFLFVSSIVGFLLVGVTVQSIVFGFAALSILSYSFVTQAIAAPSYCHGRLTLRYAPCYLYVLASVLYVLPAHLSGIVHWRRQKTWLKTAHTRTIKIDDVS